MLTFVGGVLSFCAVVIGIINTKLKKARTTAAKERVISQVFGVASVGFPFMGIVLGWGFGITVALVLGFCLGTVFVSLGYLWTTAAIRRGETLLLVVSWCGAILMLIFDLLRGMLESIDKLIAR